MLAWNTHYNLAQIDNCQVKRVIFPLQTKKQTRKEKQADKIPNIESSAKKDSILYKLTPGGKKNPPTLFKNSDSVLLKTIA